MDRRGLTGAASALILLLPSCSHNLLDAIRDDNLYARATAYTLTIQSSGPGTTSPAGDVTAKYGYPLGIQAVANAGATFVQWTKIAGNGVALIADASLAATQVTVIEGDVTLRAGFVDLNQGIEVTKTGVPVPDGTGEVDLGETILSGTTNTTLTIKSTGTDDLIISSINLTGGATGDFILTPSVSLPASVAPGATIDLAVSFDPSAIGGRICTVSIMNEATGFDPYTFSLIGSGGMWTQYAAVLSAAGQAANDYFGFDVDVIEATIGATDHTFALSSEYGNNTRQGAVGFFTGFGSWTTEPGGSSGSLGSYADYGFSVALTANPPNGQPFAAIGIPGHPGGTPQGGRVHILQRDTGPTWALSHELEPSGIAIGDMFGAAVAIAGTYGVCGSPSRTEGGSPGAGAVYIFDGNGSYYGDYVGFDLPRTESRKLTGDAAANAFFGSALAVSGDFVAVGE